MRAVTAFSVVLLTLGLVAPPALTAASASAVWRADAGYRAANGTTTVTLFDAGNGSVLINLRGLPKGKPVSVTLRQGACYKQGSVLATLAAGKSSAAGKTKKSVALPAVTMAKIVASPARIAVVKAGSFTTCGDLALTGPIPSGGFGSGMQQVGKSAAAGTYRTRIPTAGCYWERLSGFSGEVSDILANDNTDSYAVVTIAPTDAGFSSSRCAPWSPDLSQVTASQTMFGPGTFIVGTDLEPGRYQSSNTSSGCYWERLSGFSGTISDIIANDNVETGTIVEIASTDRGFSSQGCGVWTPAP